MNQVNQKTYNKNALTLLVPEWLFSRLLTTTQVVSGLPTSSWGSRRLPRGTRRARHMSAIIPRPHPATPPTTAGFSRPSCRPPAHCPDPPPINLTPLGHQVVESDAFLTLILVV